MPTATDISKKTVCYFPVELFLFDNSFFFERFIKQVLELRSSPPDAGCLVAQAMPF